MQHKGIEYKQIRTMFGKYEWIPKNWDLLHMSHENVMSLSSGESIKSICQIGAYPIFGSNGIIGYADKYNEDDAILIGRVGASGSIHYLDEKVWVTDNVLIGKISKHVDKRFIYYALINAKLIRFATKSAQPLLTQSILKFVKLKIPSLNEQKKIASILSNVDALIQNIDKSIKQNEKFKQALLEKLLISGIDHNNFQNFRIIFKKILVIPTKWNIFPLNKIADLERGISYSSNDINDHGKGAAFINLNCFSRGGGFIDKGLIYFHGVTTKDNISPGSIIVAITDVTRQGNVIGSPMIIPSFGKQTIYHSMDAVKLKLKSQIDIKFLYYLLSTNFWHKYIIAYSAGTTVLHLHVSSVKKIKIPVPPYIEQKKIASILSGVDALIQKNQEYKASLILLKKGLMQQLLTGKIRVKVK